MPRERRTPSARRRRAAGARASCRRGRRARRCPRSARRDRAAGRRRRARPLRRWSRPSSPRSIDEHGAVRAIRRCSDDDRPAILAIVNAAAEAYRGVIPADRFNDPYMPAKELDADLIRHAYVVPDRQRGGVGAALLRHLMRDATRRTLVGTWAAAEWAIAFYRRNGFELLSRERTAALLREYWSIPERQIETSVVLARPPFD